MYYKKNYAVFAYTYSCASDVFGGNFKLIFLLRILNNCTDISLRIKSPLALVNVFLSVCLCDDW